jgi:serine/threonine-protein kinase
MANFDLPPNSRVGRYDLLAPLAQGGMGAVYLARIAGTIGTEKLVAVKVIHAQYAAEQSFVSMFLDEGRIASRLNHPNVCTTFDVGVDNGIYYQAMEYLHGEPLSAVLKRCAQGRPDEKTRLLAMARVIADACEGLHSAHEARGQDGGPLGIVHRDISPHNIFVTYEGAVKVVDFGVAKAAERLEQTKTGTLKGKVQYFAPEQLEGKPIDRGVDIWAMGICLWEALTMRHLFKRETDAASMMAIIKGEVTPPGQYLALPEGLQDVTMRALAREREHRFASARDLSRELQRVIARTGDIFGIAELGDFMCAIFADSKADKDARLMQVRRDASTLLAEAAGHRAQTGGFAAQTGLPPPPSSMAPATAPAQAAAPWAGAPAPTPATSTLQQHGQNAVPTSTYAASPPPPPALPTGAYAPSPPPPPSINLPSPPTSVTAQQPAPPAQKGRGALVAGVVAALAFVGVGGAYAAGLIGPPPDSDKDGIADQVDACPNEAGEIGRKGCPNKDHDDDGILDADDACPAEKGVAQEKGCAVKDVDGDGVPDKADGCPTEQGPADRKGCPLKDRDNDGVADDVDDCPAEAGTAADKGCPPKPVDTDGDGVVDDMDLCPSEAGVAERNGCSKTAKDTDGDGIVDSVDVCPKKKGFLATKGCPDAPPEAGTSTAPTTRPTTPSGTPATTKATTPEPEAAPMPLVREGTLMVAVKNAGGGVKVFIDGAESPQAMTIGIKLPPGNHMVKVVPASGPPEERVIEVRSSAVRTVSFDLGGTE